jgi:hypothetical protein
VLIELSAGLGYTTRAQDYQEFVTFWEQRQAQGVWERLRQTLDAAGTVAETSAEAEEEELS